MLPILLLLAALASHVLPHPWWNFTAVGGSLLFWGARRPLASAVIPVALLAAGDWYLTRFVYGYPFHLDSYQLTWSWYALVVVLGFLLLRGSPGFLRVGTATLLAPTSFFLVSNYTVWAMPTSWYPHTFAGLETCYLAALPFYRNDLLSTSLVTGLVWGLPALAARMRPDAEDRALLSRL